MSENNILQIETPQSIVDEKYLRAVPDHPAEVSHASMMIADIDRSVINELLESLPNHKISYQSPSSEDDFAASLCSPLI